MAGTTPIADLAAAAAATHQQQEAIVAALCVNAPSDLVRDCLRKYEPKKRAGQIEAAFKQQRKQVLVDTLAYLGVKNMNQYRHEILPRELLCRVQNLFPDTCHLCKQEYCVTLQDKPIVHCASCGQGCHNECVLQLLGISAEELNEENEHGTKLLNPHASIGLIYLCGECQNNVLPQKQKMRNTQSSTNQTTGGTQLPAASSGQETDVRTEEQAEPTNAEETPDTPEVLQGTNHSVTENAPNATSRDAAGDQSSSDAVQNRSARNSRQRNEQPPQICKFYKLGRCKYGISGQKDGLCPFSHPKACQRYIANGTKAPRGCTKGENCRFFHPRLCNASVRNRTCINKNCKFLHLRGTKRSGDEETSALTTTGPSQKPRNIPDIRQQVVGNPAGSAGPTASDSFLDHMKAVQHQMAQIAARLQQMDTNYLDMQQQLQSFSGQMKISPYTSPHLGMYPPMYPQVLAPKQFQAHQGGVPMLAPHPGCQ